MLNFGRPVSLPLTLVAVVCALSASALLARDGAARTHDPRPVAGTVVSVDAATGNVVIQTETARGAAGQQVTVATDANTVVTIGGQASAVTDLTAGMLVKVTFTAADVAATITASPPPPIAGTVVSVDATTGGVVVQTEAAKAAASQQVTVATDTNTVVKIGGQVSAVANLAAGMLIKVTFTAADVAATITAFPPPPIVGTVVSVDATTGDVVVQTEAQKGAAGEQVTVATDTNTVVKIAGQVSAVMDLTAGMLVKVTFTAADVASTITAFPPPPIVGTVLSVDATTGDVVVQTEAANGAAGEQVTVATDTNTVVKIAGQASAVTNLTAGMLVKVTFTAADVAATITAFAPPPVVGTVVSVDAATGNVVVQTEAASAVAGRQVTVATDANTVVKIGGQVSAVANLGAGMLVKVTFTAADVAATITAFAPPPIAGTVVSVDTTTGDVVVQTEAANAQQVTVATDANTVVKIAGQVSALANLAQGMLVKVTFTAADVAATITAFPPQPISGTVVSVDTTTGDVVVQTEAANAAAGQQVTVATDANTVVTIDGQASAVANLVAGMIVKVTFTTADVAATIVARTPPPPRPIAGTVVSVDATTGDVVVETTAVTAMGTGQDVTVTTDANTVVTIDGQTSAVTDLTAGMLVRVTFTSTGTAATIQARQGSGVQPQTAP